LAPYVGASMDIKRRDAAIMRPSKPTLITSCQTGAGLQEVAATITHDVLFTELVRTDVSRS
ncbi:MAG: urease accessory protein UreG, partial [Actinomycetota bacterium]|nr:urease accessory protein UreG [Actinomycetota bacterium]